MDANKLMELMKAKKQALKQKEKTIKPQPGANRYIVLQGWRAGEEHIYYHDFGQHYIKNAAGEIQAVYPCASKTYDKPCPVCDGLGRMGRQVTDDETQAVLKDAAAAQTYLLNVLALDSAEPNVPQILEIKKTAFSQVVDIVDEWGVAVLSDVDPQIVTINREGKGISTKYSVQISPKKHPMPAGVIAKIRNLDEYVAQENEEAQRRAINAIANIVGVLPAASTAPRIGATPDTPLTRESELTGADDHNAKQAAKSVSLDDDLDDLLSDLDAA